jgi:Tol biopolymer transport system component
VRDLMRGTTELVSVSSRGVQGNQGSDAAVISGDGRFVVFRSEASNLVAGDTNKEVDLFIRDRLRRTTELVNIRQPRGDGSLSRSDLTGWDVSAHARFVAFGNDYSVFVWDRARQTTEEVSAGRYQAYDGDEYPSISADGRFVAFLTNERDFQWLVVLDGLKGTVKLVTDAERGQPIEHRISGDGRFVVYRSDEDPRTGVEQDTEDLFVRAMATGATERVRVSTSGAQVNASVRGAATSADGRFVAFDSSASNLVAGDTNRQGDVFVRDRAHGTTERLSLSNGQAQANGYSSSPAISANGRFVAFDSNASNLVATRTRKCGKLGNCTSVFVRDRVTKKTSLVSIGYP